MRFLSLSSSAGRNGSAGPREPCGEPEGADIAGVDLERPAHSGRCLDACVGQVGGRKLLESLGDEGMHAGAEESPHLLRGDRIPSVEDGTRLTHRCLIYQHSSRVADEAIAAATDARLTARKSRPAPNVVGPVAGSTEPQLIAH